jgi:hypothetical protein
VSRYDLPMPTIRLATDADMRAIDTRNLSAIDKLPWFYIPTETAEVMRSWGVARAEYVAEQVRLHPGTLVAPHGFGQWADRGDLLYHGAEPAADFLPLA